MTTSPAVESDKLARLLAALDPAQPAAAAVRASGDAGALLDLLARPPRARFRFDYQRKGEMLAFLREHYGSWRQFDLAPARRFEEMELDKARGSRATVGIAALGQAWWATGDERFGRAFERFYLNSPTGAMFSWGSFNGSQPAYELPAYFLLLDCPGFSTAGRIAFLDHLQAITAEAWDIHTSVWPQNSLGTEGHNWYLHGMHCLPFFGLLFPEFARSAFFLKTGWSVIEEHVRGHYKSDGGARETTLGYQVGNMHCLWDFYLIAHRNGHPIAPGMLDMLVRATKFLLRLASPAATIPAFGDTGSGDYGLSAMAAVAAALSGDGECKWYARHLRPCWPTKAPEALDQIPEAAFWDVGLEGARAFAQVRERNPNHVSVLMGPTGYAALRDHDGPEACYLAIAAADRGPIVTSHGHNEIFSLDLRALGARFLGVPSCAPYGTSPGRDYDQLTEAHNCLVVEGLEQSPPLGEWRWSRVVTPAVRRWISEPTHDFFHGVHEGFYTYRQHDVLHARKVLFLKGSPATPGYWIVTDWVESVQENGYRVYFHGCVSGAAAGRSILLQAPRGPRLAVIPPQDDALTLEPVNTPGRQAYLAETGSDPATHPCFVYARRGKSDSFPWVLLPQAAGETGALPVVERVPASINGKREDAHGVTALKISFPTHDDLLCLSHKDFDAELEFAGVRAWGHLAFRRVARDGRTTLAITHTMADGVCGR